MKRSALQVLVPHKAAPWLAFLVAACSGAQVVAPPPPPPQVTDDWPARPEVQGPVQAAFPTPNLAHVHADPNGGSVRVVVVGRHAAPIVHFRWLLPGGRAREIAAKWPEGTLQLAADMVTLGTKSHPEAKFAAEVAALGGALTFTALADGVVIEGRVLSHRLDAMLALVREAVTEPQIAPKDLENLRQRYRAALENDLSDPSTVADRIARRLLHGQHVYGSSGLTLASVGRITRKHVLEAVQQGMRLGRSTLVLVGDVQAQDVAATLDTRFGALLDQVGPPVAVGPSQLAETPACHVVDVPGAAQAALVQVAPAPARNDKAWPLLQAANQVLGGSASSRLFTELREKQGLTYGIYSGFEGRRAAGQWTLSSSVRPEVLGPALRAIEAEVRRLGQENAPPEEVQAATRYLAGQFALSLAEPDQLADRLAAVALYDLPDGTWEKYLDAVQNAGPSSIRAVGKDLAEQPLVTVVVGPLQALRPALDGRCPRLVQRDEHGAITRVLVGSDAEMGEAGRQQAFAIWPASPDGQEALGRYVADPQHSAVFRAQALALLAKGPQAQQVLPLGRKAPDWHAVAAPLRQHLLGQLRAPEAEAARAGQILLAMATDKGPDGALQDCDPAIAAELQRAVGAWAFAGLETATPAEEVQARVEARLKPGDLQRLGEAVGPALEHWIAADVRRHEAAQALSRIATPELVTALVQGYRRLFGRGIAADAEDLQILSAVPRSDALVLLFDLHALHEKSDAPASLQAKAATMRTIRERLARMAADHTLEKDRSDLQVQLDRFEPHVEALLTQRNADDRWYAAELLVKYRGLSGVRRVLAGLAVDDHYRHPRFHTVDPKVAIGKLSRDLIAPLGPEVEPLMLAALAGKHPVGKVIAVTVLKALGSSGAMQALRTHGDETEVSALLDLSAPVTVRDLAVAAVDVRKFWKEIEAAVAEGKLSQEAGQVYKDLAFFTFDLEGRRLRVEVARLAAEKLGSGTADGASELPGGPTPSTAAPTTADGEAASP